MKDLKDLNIAEKIALIDLISDKIAELEVRGKIMKDSGTIRKHLLMECAAKRAFYDGILEKISMSL